MTPRLSQILSETHMKNATRTSHHAFDPSSFDERCVSEENRPFFLERKENGSASKNMPILDDNDEMRQASPYVFHYYNENLELHRDLFLADNNNNNDDDDDDGGGDNQMKGNEGSDDDDDGFSTLPNENGLPEAKSPHLSNPDFLKISSSESGIAYYIDLHGHASKKGINIVFFR